MADPFRYFRIEAGELLEQLQVGLLQLERGPADSTLIPRLLRHAHTLKGAARVVRQPETAELAHALEDVLVPVRDGTAALTPAVVERALSLLDSIRAQTAALPLAEAPALRAA